MSRSPSSSQKAKHLVEAEEAARRKAAKVEAKAKAMAALQEETLQAQQGKQSMRPVVDVMNRVKHDSYVSASPFVVGYLDRFLGIQEAPFTRFISHSDYTDIPMHRIQYLRYYSLHIWNKIAKFDRVFGSKKSTLTYELQHLQYHADIRNRLKNYNSFDDWIADTDLFKRIDAHEHEIKTRAIQLEKQIQNEYVHRINGNIQSQRDHLASYSSDQDQKQDRDEDDHHHDDDDHDEDLIAQDKTETENASASSYSLIPAQSLMQTVHVSKTAIDNEVASIQAESTSISSLSSATPSCVSSSTTSTSTSSNKKKPPKSARPNYFVSLRITNPTLLTELQRAQTHILSKNDSLKDACVHPGTFHITLCLLALKNQDQVMHATQIFRDSQEQVREILKKYSVENMFGSLASSSTSPSSISSSSSSSTSSLSSPSSSLVSLVIEEIGHFGSNVIFASASRSSIGCIALEEIRLFLCMRFHQHGLVCTDFEKDGETIKEFTPHITIAKMSRMRNEIPKWKQKKQRKNKQSIQKDKNELDQRNEIDNEHAEQDSNNQEEEEEHKENTKMEEKPIRQKLSKSMMDDFDFVTGEKQEIGVLDLCSMTGRKQEDGYYQVECRISCSSSIECPRTTQCSSSSPLRSSLTLLGQSSFSEVMADLFTCPADAALAHCVSCDLAMSKGIAVSFKNMFNGLDELKGQNPVVGGCLVLERPPRVVYYLTTKDRYHDKPTYSSLQSSLNCLRDDCVKRMVSHLCIPRLGCGLDKLNWSVVRDMIRDTFQGTNTTITVYFIEVK